MIATGWIVLGVIVLAGVAGVIVITSIVMMMLWISIIIRSLTF